MSSCFAKVRDTDLYNKERGVGGFPPYGAGAGPPAWGRARPGGRSRAGGFMGVSPMYNKK